jgi:hypothetical protein
VSTPDLAGSWDSAASSARRDRDRDPDLAVLGVDQCRRPRPLRHPQRRARAGPPDLGQSRIPLSRIAPPHPPGAGRSRPDIAFELADQPGTEGDLQQYPDLVLSTAQEPGNALDLALADAAGLDGCQRGLGREIEQRAGPVEEVTRGHGGGLVDSRRIHRDAANAGGLGLNGA